MCPETERSASGDQTTSRTAEMRLQKTQKHGLAAESEPFFRKLFSRAGRWPFSRGFSR
jgi:hypothetical protein